VQNKKSTETGWEAQEITYRRTMGSVPHNKIGVTQSTALSPALVSMSGLGVMIYDEDAATLSGPLAIQNELVSSALLNGDQWVLTTNGLDPETYVVPLNAFLGIELPPVFAGNEPVIPAPVDPEGPIILD
ncbi:MAG: hypothetical protein VW274_06565, partial [Thalassolituus sp.]